MAWEFTGDRPIYLQLVEQLELGIISGVYPPGSRLPGVRELAAQAAVNPNTMQKALSELERTGLVYTQRTSGRFITEDQQMIQQTREALASELIRAFLEQMQRLGFCRGDAIRLLEHIEKEES